MNLKQMAAVALVFAGCASTRTLTNPSSSFPLQVSAAAPAFLLPVDLSHLGSGTDPLALAAAVSSAVVTRHAGAVVAGQAQLEPREPLASLSLELAEAIRTEAPEGNWELTGPSARTAAALALKLGAPSEAALMTAAQTAGSPTRGRVRFLIALHSHGEPTMGGAVLKVVSWGGIYDLEQHVIASYLETVDTLANKPEAAMATLSATYNGLLSKLLQGNAPGSEAAKK